MSEESSGAGKNKFPKNMAALERKLGVRFDDKALLLEALTHPSYPHENPEENARHYERLEYLGDAVIELAISHLLFELRAEYTEGSLTRARADLVNTHRLAQMAMELGLPDNIRLGTGERKSGGMRKSSILAASFEAVIGAAYLDRGWKRTFKIIERMLGPTAESQPEDLRDPRSALQEWSQARGGAVPEYRYMKPSGPPHKRTFSVEVLIDGKVVAKGEGKSKKDACRKTAAVALKVVAAQEYNK